MAKRWIGRDLGAETAQYTGRSKTGRSKAVLLHLTLLQTPFAARRRYALTQAQYADGLGVGRSIVAAERGTRSMPLNCLRAVRLDAEAGLAVLDASGATDPPRCLLPTPSRSERASPPCATS